MLISHHPPGPEKQEEVRDGNGTGGKEKGASLPAWPAFAPLRLCLLSLPWLRRPHLIREEHSAAPAGPWRTPGQHQGGSPERGRKHLTGLSRSWSKILARGVVNIWESARSAWFIFIFICWVAAEVVNISAQKRQPGLSLRGRLALGYSRASEGV